MATQAQMEANRRNAQRSTGPKTEYGKQAAKFNAIKHGMTAETSVLPYEDAEAFEELREAFMTQYDPANAVEATLVETIVNSYWRLLRSRRVECASYDLHIRTLKGKHKLSEKPDPKKDDQAIAVIFSRDDGYQIRLDRWATRVERCYFQAIETLRKVQKERHREERLQREENRREARLSAGSHAAKIGFVSHREHEYENTSEIPAGMRVTDMPEATIHIVHPEERIEQPFTEGQSPRRSSSIQSRMRK